MEMVLSVQTFPLIVLQLLSESHLTHLDVVKLEPMTLFFRVIVTTTKLIQQWLGETEYKGPAVVQLRLAVGMLEVFQQLHLLTLKYKTVATLFRLQKLMRHAAPRHGMICVQISLTPLSLRPLRFV